MANGEGHWAAIAELRDGHTRHERELGGISARVESLNTDVNELGEETRKTRHALKNDLAATEMRITDHVDQRMDAQAEATRAELTALNNRFDRAISTLRWVIGLSVPAVCTLLGLLIGSQ